MDCLYTKMWPEDIDSLPISMLCLLLANCPRIPRSWTSQREGIQFTENHAMSLFAMSARCIVNAR